MPLPLCLTPHALDVLAGRAPVDDVRYVRPPFRAGARATRSGKTVYGGDLAHHVDGAYVTVQWEDDGIDEAMAAAYADQLDDGFVSLVEEQGWPAPVSSDRYLLWVILDPTLSGTGLTTEYTTDDYPDGYPVIYLNPGWWTDYEAFSRSVAVHELSHAIQFAVRDWSASADETWYWEASAEWTAELGEPDLDGYTYSAPYYAEHTAYAYDSLVDAHQYGMFVLPAWVTQAWDVTTFQHTWTANGGDAWTDVVEAQTGEDFGTTIGQMAAAYAGGTLRESALYEAATEAGTFDGDALTVDADLYGSAIYTTTTPAAVDGPGRLDPVDADTIVVTRTGTGELRLVADDGEGDTAADTAGKGDTAPETAPPQACGCAGVGGAPAWLGLLVVAGAGRRRR